TRRIDQSQLAIRSGAADELWRFAGAAFPLPAEPEETRLILRDVTDGERFEFAGHGMLGDELAALRIDENQRRLHRVEIGLGTPSVGDRIDAAVSDRNRLAVRQQHDLVRSDSVARMFADLLVFTPDVVNSDNAALTLDII